MGGGGIERERRRRWGWLRLPRTAFEGRGFSSEETHGRSPQVTPDDRNHRWGGQEHRFPWSPNWICSSPRIGRGRQRWRWWLGDETGEEGDDSSTRPSPSSGWLDRPGRRRWSDDKRRRVKRRRRNCTSEERRN